MKRTLTLICTFVTSLAILSISCISKGEFDPPRDPMVIEIPKNYPTIQEGINHAYNGDTIIVEPGRYYENISFNGKNILLTSHFYYNQDVSMIEQTIIDGSRSPNKERRSCVIFESNEDNRAVLQGFTITNGKGSNSFWVSDLTYFVGGGGIEISHSSPTIRFNRIVNNGTAEGRMNGGGIGIHDSSSPVITNNLIAFNQGSMGAGISIWGECGGVIKNNIISNNKGGYMYGGGGIAIDGSKVLIENNTIAYNQAVGNGAMSNGAGGALVVWAPAPKQGEELLTLRNNIFWGNTQEHGDVIAYSNSRVQISVSYSLVEGGFPGEGNIDTDPLFQGDSFRLSPDSPCISSGISNSEMGAYGGDQTFLISSTSMSK